MRQKVSKEEKKKSITFTINPEIEKLLIQQIEKLGISKSKFIEEILEEKLKG
jgi:hypothetical protein